MIMKPLEDKVYIMLKKENIVGESIGLESRISSAYRTSLVSVLEIICQPLQQGTTNANMSKRLY